MANSDGLAKVVLFTGLSHSVLMHPVLHGEPVLTAQAFYYLDELETVAKVRFEKTEDELNEGDLEYLIDNYLFEFSKLYPTSTITSKVEWGKFWIDDFREFYIEVDQRHTQSLAIDVLNDPKVHSVRAEEPNDTTDLSDWDIGRSYTTVSLQSYLDALTATLEKKVVVAISPSVDRVGYRGKLSVFKAGSGLIDYWQASALADIDSRQITSSMTTIPLPRSSCRHTEDSLQLERIVGVKQYAPILLSHYFSGLKESNPLKAFVGFYNVLEYYFEDASLILRRVAQNERTQLEHVVFLIASSDEVTSFINCLPPLIQQSVFADIPTSSGLTIRGLNIETGTDARPTLTRWLYDIRCAVIHSKRTRRGLPTPTFEPYSPGSHALRAMIPVIQWLAVQCIEKDHFIRIAQSSEQRQ
jgi:hypothetical protein